MSLLHRYPRLQSILCEAFQALAGQPHPDATPASRPSYEERARQPHLHVMTCINNPANYESRVRLYKKFAEHMAQFPNVTLWTIEGAYEGREYQVTSSDHPHHVQVFLKDEIWHKENLINVLFAHLPKEAEYVAWVDADVIFTRMDWAEATIEALQRHPVVQLFSQCADLDSRGMIADKELGGETMNGMVYEWYRNGGMKPCAAYGRPSGHCGYAWAARREAFEIMGGLIDFSIVGSADFQMACALMGSIEDSVSYPASAGYLEALKAWGARIKHLNGKVGYITGLVLHNWHGHKAKRGYHWRVNIMTKHGYAPQRDLVKDGQGIYCWNRENPEHNPELQGELYRYFRYRNEDVPSHQL